MKKSQIHNRLLELFLAQQGKCFYCNKPMDSQSYPSNKNGFTKDHFMPKSKGNSLNRNKVLAHFKCNQEKKNKSPTMAQLKKFDFILNQIEKRKKLLGKMK